MEKFQEDGIAGTGPTNSVGNFGYTSKGDPKTKGGFDTILKFKKSKKTVKEEELDSNTIESRKRFKKNSIPKNDPKDDTESEFLKFVENKKFSDFIKQCKRKQ